MSEFRKFVTPALRAALWSAWKRGSSVQAVASMLDVSVRTVKRTVYGRRGFALECRRNARALTELERERISRGIARGLSLRAIARELGRSPSSVTREVERNGGRAKYRACRAEKRAWRCAKRPKRTKLATNPRLRCHVEDKLRQWWSPVQIHQWLRITFGDDPTMSVSHETIYKSLFVQARGELKQELAAFLRTGRDRRSPRREGTPNTSSIVDGISISQRPAEVADRAVPGHWEGDLLMGGVSSQMVTLVERSTRYCMLIKVASRNTRDVTEAIRKHILRLPAHLRKSLTWDQGSELSAHKQFSVESNVPVFFADPKSPWQRGTNENTNGLLRQWFPKGVDVSKYTQAQLDKYAHLLNGRPRQTLGWKSPAQAFNDLLR
jgi:IS30 family transposase